MMSTFLQMPLPLVGMRRAVRIHFLSVLEQAAKKRAGADRVLEHVAAGAFNAGLIKL